ncbi:BCCT family transporter [Algoriphagus sp. oki45]|uniref:BCCT family transporter n=1 Tax=Algoriphagus sp. oki45 TaxID=3067294 RepID=UPI0027F50E24|nr:BCCT family transporter [Algoriphagus sp. oki45]
MLKAIASSPFLLRLTFGVLALFLILALFFGEGLAELLAKFTLTILGYFGGYYLFLGFASVVVLIMLAVLPTGKIKLGSGPPEFSWWSWLAMLYSTGMGGGLILRAVQEPVYFFQNPPRAADVDAKTFALEYTFFHWGLTPWAFYGLMALVVSFNLYIKKGSSLSSESLLGRGRHRLWAGMIDLFILLCTLFGVVAGVGLGSRQLMEAIRYWTGWDFVPTQVIIPLFFICFLATLSAFLGVRKGIRLISNLNMAGASLLMVFAWTLGSFWEIIESLGLGLFTYLGDFVSLSLNLGKAQVGDQFLKDWTYFYWAFWLSWAPFTGVFIARISKGRTIRELVSGALLIPALGTFLWFSVFGTRSFGLIEAGQVSPEAFSSIYSSILIFFSHFSFSPISNLVVTVLVSTFLITSIDSAIFVLSIFSDQGKAEPNSRIRVFWGVSIFIFTAILIWVGKEGLLESVSNLLILFALPFSLIFILLIGQFIRYQINSTLR